MAHTRKNGSRNGRARKSSAPHKRAAASRNKQQAPEPVSAPERRLPEKADANLPAHRHVDAPKADKSRLNIGLASILAQSEAVTNAFGKPLGFVLIMSAVVASTGVSGTLLIVAAKGLGRLF